MNDQFLKRYRAAPRPEFVEELRKRLETKEEKPIRRLQALGLRPVVLSLMTLLLVLTLTLTISPSARAQVQDWVEQVGNMMFTATNDYPGGDEPVTIVQTDTLSLEEARAQVAFPIDLPAWVPAGYVLQEKVNVTHFNDAQMTMYEIDWHAPEKATFSLTIIEQRPNGKDNQFVIGQESIEEVQVNGVTAALVRGGWNADARQWDNPDILTLYLDRGGQTYIFQAFERDISIDDLVRIAGSLP
jgi:hypothetical protein